MIRNKLCFCLIILLLITGSQTAFANAGPVSDFPYEQNIFFFDEESNISLVEATVRFSEFDNSIWIPASRVSVSYKLKNLDDFDKDLTIYFVIPASDGRKITLNGADITDKTEYRDIEVPDNWEPMSSTEIVNPVDKEVVATPYYDYFEESPYDYNAGEPNGILIPISIGANDEANLEIEYTSHGGFYRGHINEIHGFIYYLTPAKFWEGDPKLNLVVELPSDRYKFYSNIPLEKTAQGVYETTLKSIPDTEWQFSFFSTEGLIFGTNNPETENMIVLSILAAIYILLLVLAIIKKNKTIFWVGHIASGTLYLMYFMKITHPYSFFPPFLMIYLFIYTMYLLTPKVIIEIFRSFTK